MPDAAPATAPAPAAPAAAAPPPETVAPATAPETATPAPAATQKTVKQTDHQRVQAAAKLLEKAGSAKESAAPDAPGEKPAEAEPVDPDKSHEVTNAEWKEIRTRAKRLEKREESIAAREHEYKLRDQAVAQANQRIQAFHQREQLLKTDPRAFLDFVLKESGTDFVSFYEKLANEYIETARPESQLELTKKELQEVKKTIRERDELLKQREEQAKQQQTEAQRRQYAHAFLAVAATSAHPNTQFTLRSNGVETIMSDAVTVANDLSAKLKRMVTDAEVAKELDARYAAYYDAIEAGRRPAAAHGGAADEATLQAPRGVAPQQGTVETGNAVAPKAPTTLTNGGSAMRTASGRKMTDAERIKAAAALMPDIPRPRGV